VLVLTVVISGSLMYMLENAEQPGVFSSIPSAMWWAIETLATVGYGDMVPITVAGRLIGGVVSIVGIGTLALFSGLITVGFLDQLRPYREQHPKVAVAVTKTDSYGELTRKTLALSATCPHWGAALSLSATRRDSPGDDARVST
jgi:voltage-gated potassium channel